MYQEKRYIDKIKTKLEGNVLCLPRHFEHWILVDTLYLAFLFLPPQQGHMEPL